MEDTQQHDAGGVIEITRQSSSMGLIIRQKEPDNLESPFLPVDSFLTPTELFYIRSHFAAPKLDLVSYQLHIDGAVRNPLSLSYRQLRDMPSETRVAILVGQPAISWCCRRGQPRYRSRITAHLSIATYLGHDPL